ncbi:Protein of unknown function [Gryllus bimaculatus]|nr:Protein of unknown function [Gryllus bimaculatus]
MGLNKRTGDAGSAPLCARLRSFVRRGPEKDPLCGSGRPWATSGYRSARPGLRDRVHARRSTQSGLPMFAFCVRFGLRAQPARCQTALGVVLGRRRRQQQQRASRAVGLFVLWVTVVRWGALSDVAVLRAGREVESDSRFSVVDDVVAAASAAGHGKITRDDV